MLCQRAITFVTLGLGLVLGLGMVGVKVRVRVLDVIEETSNFLMFYVA
jgi:hypothetical protein